MQAIKHPQSPSREARHQEINYMYHPIQERPETAPPQRSYFVIVLGRVSTSAPSTGTAQYFDLASVCSSGPSSGYTSEYYYPRLEDAGYFGAQPLPSPNGSSPAWEPLTPGSDALPSPLGLGDQESSRTRSASSSSIPLKKITRPPNAWILYRSDKILEVKAHAGIRTPQAELSKLIAERWRNESPEVKQRYELQAKKRKQEHDSQNPGYKFKPQKKSDKEPVPLSDRKEKSRTSSRLRRAKSSTTVSKRYSPLAADEAPKTLSAPAIPGDNNADSVRDQFNAIWNTNEIIKAQPSPENITLSPSDDLPTPALSEDGPSLFTETWQPQFDIPATSFADARMTMAPQHSSPFVQHQYTYAITDQGHDMYGSPALSHQSFPYGSPALSHNSLSLQVPSPESQHQQTFDHQLRYQASAPADASNYSLNMAPRSYDWPTQHYNLPEQLEYPYQQQQQHQHQLSSSTSGPALYQEMQEWVVQPVPFDEFTLEY